MAFGKKTGLKGMTYQGSGPLLAWYLHRIGGLVMVLFIASHMTASFLSRQLNSGVGAQINRVYESWITQVFLYFFVIFHALNGLRIILLDLWPRFLRYQREITWIEWLILLPIYGLAVFLMVQRALAGG